MRLICANCGAAYEVPASAIPEAGREVKCSACGHAWLQRAGTVAPRRPVDPQALSILREEAAREAIVRGTAGAPPKLPAQGPAGGEDRGRGEDGFLAPAGTAGDRPAEAVSPPAERNENTVSVEAFPPAGPVEGRAGDAAVPPEGPFAPAPAPAEKSAALRDPISADPVIPESLPDMGSLPVFHREADESRSLREGDGLRPVAEAGIPPTQEVDPRLPKGIDAARKLDHPSPERESTHAAQETQGLHPAPAAEGPSATIRPDAPKEPASAPAAVTKAWGDTLPAPLSDDLPLSLETAPMADARSSLPSEANVPPPRTEDRPDRPLPDPHAANSTLMPVEEARRGRFGAGFVLALLLVGLLAGLYVVAPGLREDAPAVAPYLDAYVSTIDAARLWLDRTVAPLLDRLRP